MKDILEWICWGVIVFDLLALAVMAYGIHNAPTDDEEDWPW